MSDFNLVQHIEALIFSSEQPITLVEIKNCIEEAAEATFPTNEIEDTIAFIKNKYRSEEYFFELTVIASGYQFLTKSAFHATIGIHLKQKNKKRLSRAALETLSIIAYKQPVTKGEIEQIRGVNADYAVQKLLEKDLIAITGRSDAPGRPLIYGTSAKFMDYFGLGSLKDLPKLKDFKLPDNEIGTTSANEIEAPPSEE